MSETKSPAEESQQQSDARRDAAGSTLLGRLGLRLFGLLSGALLRLLGATWRIEILGDDPRETGIANSPHCDSRAEIAALFHESMLACAWFFRDQAYSVAVSRSRDGDLIRATLIALGYAEPARGSSSRGGSAALLGLVRQHEEGTTVAVLVDGPRGPARVAKTGIVSLARLADAPIQPVAFSARPAIRIGSWDQSLVPLPFARVVCAFGQPIESISDADEESEQVAARALDEELVALHHAADRVLLSRR
jgi:lysophospholipid acyltransferase (LPLAT)-like uncharacterized protein